jgi:hypothetical protein
LGIGKCGRVLGGDKCIHATGSNGIPRGRGTHLFKEIYSYFTNTPWGRRLEQGRPQSMPLVLALQRFGCGKLSGLMRLGSWPATIQVTRFATPGTTGLTSNGQCLGWGEGPGLRHFALPRHCFCLPFRRTNEILGRKRERVTLWWRE